MTEMDYTSSLWADKIEWAAKVEDARQAFLSELSAIRSRHLTKQADDLAVDAASRHYMSVVIEAENHGVK